MVTPSFATKAKEIFNGAELSALIDYLDRKIGHILHGHKLDEIDRIGFFQVFEQALENSTTKTLEDLVLLRTYFNNCIGGSIKVTDDQKVQFDIIVNLFKNATEYAIANRIKCSRPDPDHDKGEQHYGRDDEGEPSSS